MKISGILFFMAFLMSQISFAQRVEFEELPAIPLVELLQVFASDSQDAIYARGRSNIYESLDKGKSWEIVDWGIDENKYRINNIHFLDNGELIIQVSRVMTPFLKNILMSVQNNQVELILPTELDTLSDHVFRIHNNRIVIYGNKKFYVSDNAGQSYEVYPDAHVSREVPLKLFVTDGHIILLEIESYNDGIFDYDRGFLNVYDKDFNFIKEELIPFDWRSQSPWGSPNLSMMVEDSSVVLCDKFNRAFYYSNDFGESYVVRELGDDNLVASDPFEIRNNQLYYSRVESTENTHYILRIDLDENFVSNQIDTVYEGDNCHRSDFFNNRVAILDRCFETFEVFDLVNDTLSYYDELTFPECTPVKIHVSNSGVLQCKTQGYLFRFDENEGVWAKVRLSTYLGQFLDNGDYLYSYLLNSNDYSQTKYPGKILLDGTKEEWIFERDSIDLFYQALTTSINEDSIRIIFQQFSSQTGEVYISVDKGPFELKKISNSYFVPFNEWVSATVGNKHILASNYTNQDSNKLVFDIDDLSLKQYSDPIIDNIDEQFSFDISDKGELFANIDQGFRPNDTIYFPNYYASSYMDNYEPVSRGPAGKIFYNDVLENTLLLTTSHKLFIREELNSNFRELEIVDRDFDIIHALTFGPDGSIYLGVDYGRIVKLNNVATSTTEKILDEPRISIFPNPVSAFLNVTSLEFEIERFEFRNLQGIKIIDDFVGDYYFNVDLNDLTSGIYFISLINREGRRITKKIIVQ